MHSPIAQAVLRSKGDLRVLPENAVISMQEVGRKYPCGFGSHFRLWVFSDDPKPYKERSSKQEARACALFPRGTLEFCRTIDENSPFRRSYGRHDTNDHAAGRDVIAQNVK